MVPEETTCTSKFIRWRCSFQCYRNLRGTFSDHKHAKVLSSFGPNDRLVHTKGSQEDPATEPQNDSLKRRLVRITASVRLPVQCTSLRACLSRGQCLQSYAHVSSGSRCLPLCALCCTRIRQAADACQLTHIVAHVIVWRPMPANCAHCVARVFVQRPMPVSFRTVLHACSSGGRCLPSYAHCSSGSRFWCPSVGPATVGTKAIAGTYFKSLNLENLCNLRMPPHLWLAPCCNGEALTLITTTEKRWPLRSSDAGVRASKHTLCTPCANIA